MKNLLRIFSVISILNLACQPFMMAQSYNSDKNSLVSFVKRMFLSSPFEGGKVMEGDERTYYIVAITAKHRIDESTEQLNKSMEARAIESAKMAFTEPCVKFEMLSTVEKDKDCLTAIYLCEPLSEFIHNLYLQQPFEGVKMIATLNSNFLVSVVTLNQEKYANESVMDRVAFVKAKQQINTFCNGSTISSDLVIYPDERFEKTLTSEVIHEKALGFVKEIALLKKIISNDKTVFIYYKN